MEILVTSPWVPAEWIKAHGLQPRGLWSVAGNAAAPVAEGVCAFAHRAWSQAEVHPEIPVIFTTACDQMRRAADAVSRQPAGRTFLFNLPATWQTPAARRLYHAEVARLGKFLQRLGGRAPTSAELAAVMRNYDEERMRLRRFAGRASACQVAAALSQFFDGGVTVPSKDAPFPFTRALPRNRLVARASRPCGPEHTGETPVPLPTPSAQSGSGAPIASLGGSCKLSPRERKTNSPVSGASERVRSVEALNPFLTLSEEGGRGEGEPGVRSPPGLQTPSVSKFRTPLALVGGPLCASQWGLFDAIESAGGCVVLNATETGERCLPPPLPPQSARHDPFDRLCDHYFDHIVDVFQRPNSRLYTWLGARLAERGVRGIVLWVHVGCDLWRAEAASLREAFSRPVLVLDTTETRGTSLRDLNRLAAFIESLQASLQPFVAAATKGCTLTFETAGPALPP